MKKSVLIRKAVIFFLLSALCLGTLPLTAAAAADPSGSCGETAGYAIEGTTLTVSGTGKVTLRPWKTLASTFTEIVVDEGITGLCSACFENCSHVTAVTLPSTLKSIGNNCFANCSALTGITLPDGLETIGSNGFTNCRALQTITIPGSVRTVSDSLFSGCSALSDVTFCEGIEVIESSVFFAGTSVRELTVPASVRKISPNSFDNNDNIRTIFFLGNAPEIEQAEAGSISMGKTHAVVYYDPAASGWSGETWNGYTLRPMPSMANFTRSRTYRAGQFTDVAAGAWYNTSVGNAYELGLMKGRSSDTFAPTDNITLAETLVIACSLRSTYFGDGADFTAPAGESWYQGYVNYAISNGIIRYGDYSNYTAAASRAQFARILGSALPDVCYTAINTVAAVPDVDAASTYAAAVLRLYNAGILSGSDEYGTFRPYAAITRAEAAKIAALTADPSLRTTFTLKTA